MGQILCPMCGRNCAESIFDPNSLDLDIYIREQHGRGRAKGFSYGPYESILGDEVYSPQIYERCISLVQLFIDNNLLTKGELINRFDLKSEINKKYVSRDYHNIIINNVKNNYMKEINILNKKIKDLESDILRVKNEYEKLIKDIEKKELIESIIKKLSNAFNVERQTEDDYSIIEIEEVNLNGIVVFCREIYKLDHELRGEVVKRIKCKDERFVNIRNNVLKEPVIKSVVDNFINPRRLYQTVQKNNPSWNEIYSSIRLQNMEDLSAESRMKLDLEV
jgi:hypothetical protein